MPGIILLIEDDWSIRAFISDLLGEEGYPTHTVADGQEALTYLHTADDLPDLILLDVCMPGMDGPSFRAAQQSHPRLADIPIVLLSAAHDLGRRAAALKIPEYLEKPIEPVQLLDVVERYCMQTQMG
jgi:CheY-like chemotaxis protein